VVCWASVVVVGGVVVVGCWWWWGGDSGLDIAVTSETSQGSVRNSVELWTVD
jgi:hypothetical protein